LVINVYSIYDARSDKHQVTHFMSNNVFPKIVPFMR